MDSQQSPINSASSYDDDEISLLDLLIVLAKHKKEIVLITLMAGLIGVAVAFILPPIFTATATIMPPQKSESSAAAMLGQLGALSGLAGGAAGLKSPADLYIGLLESRTAEDALIQQFNLKAEYKLKSLEKTRKEFAKNFVATADKKSGMINIEFSDKSPQRAAAVANAGVDELNKLVSTLAITEASQKRLFFEKQVDQTKAKLTQAEQDLASLQSRAGWIQVYPQEKEIAVSNAQLRAQIAAKEVELSAMQIGATEHNPDFLRLQQELQSLKAKLQGLGDESSGAPMSQDSINYLQKYREVMFNQAVLEMMYKQYELAKVDEAKDYPVIQVLDKATPPEFKAKPKRAVITIMATFLGLIISIIWIAISQTIINLKKHLINSP